MQKAQLRNRARLSVGAAQNPKLKKEEVAIHVSDINETYGAIRQIDPSFNISAKQDGKDIILIDENTGATINEDSEAADVSKMPIPKNVSSREFFDEAVREYENAPWTVIGGNKMTKARFKYEFRKKYGDEAYKVFESRI
jgi:hypothetical protein